MGIKKKIERRREETFTFSVSLHFICSSLYGVKLERTTNQRYTVIIHGELMGSRLLGYTTNVVGTVVVVLDFYRLLFTRGCQERAIQESFTRRRLGWSCIDGVYKFLVHYWLFVSLGLAFDLVDLNRFFSLHFEGTSGYRFATKKNIDIVTSFIFGNEDTIEGTITIVQNLNRNFLPLGAFGNTLGYSYMT